MRYIEYVLVNMPLTAQLPDGKLSTKVLPYGLANWHDEKIKALPAWRDDEAMMLVYSRVMPRFARAAGLKKELVAKENDIKVFVPVDDKDYEKWMPVVTMNGAQLPQGVIDQLMQLLQPVILAPSEMPAGAIEVKTTDLPHTEAESRSEAKPETKN